MSISLPQKSIDMRETKVVVPTYEEVKGLEFSNDVASSIRLAQEADAADKELTIRQALKKYKKAVFWAMVLSTSLIMEGYDLVIVSSSLAVFTVRIPPQVT